MTALQSLLLRDRFFYSFSKGTLPSCEFSNFAILIRNSVYTLADAFFQNVHCRFSNRIIYAKAIKRCKRISIRPKVSVWVSVVIIKVWVRLAMVFLHKKIVVFPEYMEWYLRITDDGEGPIKTELSGTMKSGLTVTFNRVDNTQLSLAQHRQLSRSNS